MDNDYFEIKLYYRKVKSHYIAYSQNDFDNKITDEEEKKKFSSVNIKMKILTWGLYNDINEAAIVKNDNRDWNYKLYKENKLKSIIIDWDIMRKNEKGELELVPINQKNIMNMAPEVAELILSEYDAAMLIDEDYERKIVGQVHNFVMNGRGATGIARVIMENDLIEEHHWLPQDIAKIPYKQLMMYYLIRRTKSNAIDNKRMVDEVKRNELERGRKASGHTSNSNSVKRR